MTPKFDAWLASVMPLQEPFHAYANLLRHVVSIMRQKHLSPYFLHNDAEAYRGWTADGLLSMGCEIEFVASITTCR